MNRIMRRIRMGRVCEPYNRQHGVEPAFGRASATSGYRITMSTSAMNVSFIGGGVMAEAIISGMKQAALDVNIVVSEPIPERAHYLANTYGVTIAANNVNAILPLNWRCSR